MVMYEIWSLGRKPFEGKSQGDVSTLSTYKGQLMCVIPHLHWSVKPV